MLTAISNPTTRGRRWVPARPRYQADLDLRQTHARRFARDAEMAAQCELEPAAEAGARDRCNRRFAAALEAADQRVEGGFRHRLRRVEFLYIGATGKKIRRCR